ncbi:MAG: hypothetical protein HY731_03915 [Candidatus Tectomicrobia bacterium]|nr:hypothetical protein [Candidatus Tectomicrobia bacterium]
MTDQQKKVIESSKLIFLDYLPDQDCLVQDPESFTRAFNICYVLTKDGSVQNIDYHYKTEHQVGATA